MSRSRTFPLEAAKTRMSRRRTRTILLIALPLLGAFCGTPAPSLREPVDLPLDDIDVAATDGGTEEVQVDARDVGRERGDAGTAGTARLEAPDAGESDAAGAGGAARAEAARDASGVADATHATARDGGVDGAGAGTSDETDGEGSGAGEQDERLGIDLRGN